LCSTLCSSLVKKKMQKKFIAILTNYLEKLKLRLAESFVSQRSRVQCSVVKNIYTKVLLSTLIMILNNPCLRISQTKPFIQYSPIYAKACNALAGPISLRYSTKGNATQLYLRKSWSDLANDLQHCEGFGHPGI